MKKLALILLLVILVGCQTNEDTPQQDEQPDYVEVIRETTEWLAERQKANMMIYAKQIESINQKQLQIAPYRFVGTRQMYDEAEQTVANQISWRLKCEYDDLELLRDDCYNDYLYRNHQYVLQALAKIKGLE